MGVEQDLLVGIAKLLSMTPEMLRVKMEQDRAARQRRLAKKAAKWQMAMGQMTDLQGAAVDSLVAGGASINRIAMHQVSGNVAVMLTRPLWDTMKGRMGTKLYLVYPNGKYTATFEKKITIDPDF